MNKQKIIQQKTKESFEIITSTNSECVMSYLQDLIQNGFELRRGDGKKNIVTEGRAIITISHDCEQVSVKVEAFD